MDVKEVIHKVKCRLVEFKYAILVLGIGILLLLLPANKQAEISAINEQQSKNKWIEIEELSNILQAVDGAGNVQVLLSVSEGERTVYQVNEDRTGTGDNQRNKIDTVIVTDANRNENGLVSQINPPKYLGAIVVCQGADSPVVKLAITQAVAKITGLDTGSICVLKMK